MKAILVLSIVMSAAMADQNIPTVFSMTEVTCEAENSSKNSEKYCNSWRNRMEQEGISAIKCQDAQDTAGRGMWVCTPKWIRQTRGNDHKTIFIKYFITRFKPRDQDNNRTLHMHAIITYSESKLIDVMFPLVILVALVAVCCCVAQMDPPSFDDKRDLSFGDAFLAASLANSWSNGDDIGPQWGGEDFSYKTD